MTERKLKNYFKKNKVITHGTIIDLYRDNQKKLFFKNNSLDYLIMDNYNEIISSRTKSYLSLIIKELYNHDKLIQFLDSKIIENILIADEIEISDLFDFYFDIKSKEQISILINNNIDYLIEKLSITNLFILVKKVNLLDKNSKEKLNIKLENNKKEYINFLLMQKIKNANSFDDLDVLEDAMVKLTDEILINENKKWIDIRPLKSGTYSAVIEIGDKVLKVGLNRTTYDIPYDPRIIQPLIRFKLDKISNLHGTIEVTEKVDTNVKLNNEELYNIYKEIRERKIIYADLKPDNLGILLKDNIKHWNKELSNDFESLGYEKPNCEEILKKGEIVITDTDFIYKEGTEHINWGNETSHEFEKRYLKEKEDSMLNPQLLQLKRMKVLLQENSIDNEEININNQK